MMIKIGQQADHGFDDPIGLLSDCHRRIERFLSVLLTVTRQDRGGPLSASSRQAAESALGYFATAGPRHTADEEESLFPRLRSSPLGGGSEVLRAVDRLETDHRTAEDAHAEIDRLLRRWMNEGALAADDAAKLTSTLEALERLYAAHIAAEDREVFPFAAGALSPREVDAIGREMAARRGVPFEPPADLRRSD